MSTPDPPPTIERVSRTDQDNVPAIVSASAALSLGPVPRSESQSTFARSSYNSSGGGSASYRHNNSSGGGSASSAHDSSPQEGVAASNLDVADFESLFQVTEVDWVALEASVENQTFDFSAFRESCLENEATFQDYWLERLKDTAGVEQTHNFVVHSPTRTGPQRKKVKKEKEKKESFIRTALNDYKNCLEEEEKSLGGKGGWSKYPTNNVRGAFIKGDCRSDLACVNKETKMLFVGELKNGDKYMLLDAVRQCAAYMYHVLWWFRVVQSRAVEEVYGFCICGPSCKGMKGHVTVSFLRLGLPEKIGGRFNLSCLHEKRLLNSEDTKLKQTVDKLNAFLTQKYFEPQHIIEKLPYEQPVPGSMMLPSSFSSGENGLELIESGTAALVLKVERSKLLETSAIQEIFYVATSFKAGLIAKALERNEFKGDTVIYVKLINAAAGRYWKSKAAFRSEIITEPHDGDLGLGAYEKYSLIETVSYKMILMHDMGVPIHRMEGGRDLDFGQFCYEYLRMAEKVEKLFTERGVIHGDIHQSNVLYKPSADKGGKLSLIDWDECTIEKPLKRVVAQPQHKERYPECFSKSGMGMAYTQVQLLVLFRDFVTVRYGKYISMSGPGTDTFEITFVGEESAAKSGILSLDEQTLEHVEKCYKALKVALDKATAGRTG